MSRKHHTDAGNEPEVEAEAEVVAPVTTVEDAPAFETTVTDAGEVPVDESKLSEATRAELKAGREALARYQKEIDDAKARVAKAEKAK